MLHGALVAVDELVAEVAVDFVEVEAMLAGDEAHSVEHVGAQLVDIAGFTGIVAVNLDAAGKGTAAVFKTGDVVGLPAVHAKVEVLHLFEHFVGVDADGGIALFGNFVSLCD